MGDTMELSPTRKRSRDGPFKCKNCNREFSSAQALGGHRSGYSKPILQAMLPEDAPFTCPECGQMFLNRKSLTRHKRRRHHVTAGEKGTGSSSGEQPQMIMKDGKKTSVNPAAAKARAVPADVAEASVENNRLKKMDLNLTPFRNFLEHGILLS